MFFALFLQGVNRVWLLLIGRPMSVVQRCLLFFSLRTITLRCSKQSDRRITTFARQFFNNFRKAYVPIQEIHFQSATVIGLLQTLSLVPLDY